jgi:hypothetical protein
MSFVWKLQIISGLRIEQKIRNMEKINAITDLFNEKIKELTGAE